MENQSDVLKKRIRSKTGRLSVVFAVRNRVFAQDVGHKSTGLKNIGYSKTVPSYVTPAMKNARKKKTTRKIWPLSLKASVQVIREDLGVFLSLK